MLRSTPIMGAESSRAVTVATPAPKSLAALLRGVDAHEPLRQLRPQPSASPLQGTAGPAAATRLSPSSRTRRPPVPCPLLGRRLRSPCELPSRWVLLQCLLELLTPT